MKETEDKPEKRKAEGSEQKKEMGYDIQGMIMQM